MGQEYVAGPGLFPERAAQRNLTVRFLIDFYALVGEWAKWARDLAEAWPEDPRLARADELSLENMRRLEAVIAGLEAR